MPRTFADRFRWAWRLTSRVEAVEVRLLGTTGVAVMRRTKVLLLQTTGRRTGKRRRTPVAYWMRGGEYVVGGGAGGMTKVDWVANLRHQERAVIWVKRRRLDVAVRELSGDEYVQAKREAFEIWPDAPKYEQVSGRLIPYFALAPVEGA